MPINPWGGYQQSVNQLGQAAGMAQRGQIAGQRNQLYSRGVDVSENRLGLEREKFGAAQTAADTALRKQKMTLLAQLFRNVKDQAGYDQAIENFKLQFPDTGDIPVVYNKQQVDQMVSELDPLTMFEKKAQITAKYREPKGYKPPDRAAWLKDQEDKERLQKEYSSETSMEDRMDIRLKAQMDRLDKRQKEADKRLQTQLRASEDRQNKSLIAASIRQSKDRTLDMISFITGLPDLAVYDEQRAKLPALEKKLEKLEKKEARLLEGKKDRGKIVKRGKHKDGKTVVQYEDGTIEYAD